MKTEETTPTKIVKPTNENLPSELDQPLTDEEVVQQKADEEQSKQGQIQEVQDKIAMDSRTVGDLLDQPMFILGRQLRPIKLSTIAMLIETDNDIIKGIDVEECRNIVLDSCKFVLMQSISLREAKKLISDPEEFEMRAYEMADEMTPSDTKKFTDDCIEYLHTATETKVEAIPDEEAKAPEKPTGAAGAGE